MAQICVDRDYKNPVLQQRYGNHWLPSILAHQLGDAQPPVMFHDGKLPARAGICGSYEIARHYCPLF